jgi:Glycine zipper 2TM domain
MGSSVFSLGLPYSQLHKKGYVMRKLVIFAATAALATPAVLVPLSPAQARHREYREWRGDDGRTYCRKSDGTVGLVIGAAAGGLLGRAVDTQGSRATGTILGLAGGALLGREIDRKRRCR